MNLIIDSLSSLSAQSVSDVTSLVDEESIRSKQMMFMKMKKEYKHSITVESMYLSGLKPHLRRAFISLYFEMNSFTIYNTSDES